MKERFTQDEWAQLRLLPALVFFKVAGADGQVDQKEWQRFAEDLEGSEDFADPLMRELFREVGWLQEHDEWWQEAQEAVEDPHLVYRLKLLLESHMGGQHYHRFVATLVAWGMGIARASGGWFGLFGDKASAEEMAALDELCQFFELDPQVLIEMTGR